jgi:hypothetical protein
MYRVSELKRPSSSIKSKEKERKIVDNAAPDTVVLNCSINQSGISQDEEKRDDIGTLRS